MVEAQEFVSFFWDNVVKIIPETIRYSQNTEQFFRIALEVFRQLDENSQKQLQLASYMQRWGTLLLECQHNEVCLPDLCSTHADACSSSDVNMWTGQCLALQASCIGAFSS